jgi:hypothetical protein
MNRKKKAVESTPNARKGTAWPRASDLVPDGLKGLVNRVFKKGVVTFEVCPTAELQIKKRFPMKQPAPEFASVILRLAWMWPQLLEAEHVKGALLYLVNGGVPQFCHIDHHIPTTGTGVGGLILDKMRAFLEFEAIEGIETTDHEHHPQRDLNQHQIFSFALFEFYRYCKSIIAPLYRSLPPEKWKLLASGLTKHYAPTEELLGARLAATELKEQICTSIDQIDDRIQSRHKWIRFLVMRKVAPFGEWGSTGDQPQAADADCCQEEVVRMERAVLDAVMVFVRREKKLPTKIQVRQEMDKLQWQWIHANSWRPDANHPEDEPESHRGKSRNSPTVTSVGRFSATSSDSYWTSIWKPTGLVNLPRTTSRPRKKNTQKPSPEKSAGAEDPVQAPETWTHISKNELKKMAATITRRRKETPPTIDDLKQCLRFIDRESKQIPKRTNKKRIPL